MFNILSDLNSDQPYHIMGRGTVCQTIALRSPFILFRDDRNETNFYYEGKICEVIEPINKPWNKEPSLALKLFSDGIKTTFCKVCLECGRSRLAFSGREDVAIGKLNKFLRDVLLWSRSVLLLLAPTTRKCDSSQWCSRLFGTVWFLEIFSTFPFVSEEMKRCTRVFKRNCCLCLTWYEGKLLKPASVLSRQASVPPNFAKKGPRPSPSLGLQDQPTVNGKISEDSEAAAAVKDRARLNAYYTRGPNQVVGFVTIFAIYQKIQRYQNTNTRCKYKDIKIQTQRLRYKYKVNMIQR